ncbi:MAG: cation-translocating P-type ATPase [Candidatus Thermoplasmatota archaeon]
MMDDCPYCEVRVKNVEEHIELKHEDFTLSRFLLDSKTTLITGLLLLTSFFLFLLDASFLVRGVEVRFYRVFLLLGILVGGVPLAKEGLTVLIKEHEFDVDSLVVVASIGAILIGYWGEAAVLIFLFSLAETLEEYSIFRSRKSLNDLLDLSPSKARLLKDEKTKTVDPKELSIGDIVFVKPGERIPVDGKIIDGSSSIDESPITGESVPKEKSQDDEVFAGTLNVDGALKVEVTKKSTDSTLARIIKLVEDAEEKKAETERFVNRFAKYYTPAVLVMALFVFLIPAFVLGGAFDLWFYRTLILLVLSCPCAFVVSTPVTMVSAITKAAKDGVLIKGSKYLERIKETETVVFDKTGTLTEGKFSVTEIVPMGDMDEKELALVSGSLEGNSKHPLAEPIVDFSLQMNDIEEKKLYDTKDFTSLTGAGIQGTINGDIYRIGNPELFDLEDETKEEVKEKASEGKTVIVVEKNSTPVGLICLEDTIREGAEEVINALKTYGVKTLMLTGDGEKTARSVAEELGLDGYIADVLPEDKLSEVEKLQKEGTITMVGDGVNDAPALMKSDVGIAMGAAGSDTAMESSDMALMEDDISKLIYLFVLSKNTMRVVKENIAASIGVKFVLAALTFFGVVTLWMAVGIGDAGMALMVTLNALLLEKRSTV